MGNYLIILCKCKTTLSSETAFVRYVHHNFKMTTIFKKWTQNVQIPSEYHNTNISQNCIVHPDPKEYLNHLSDKFCTTKRTSTMIVRSTCLGLLTIIELDECCILLVEENLYTNYVAIHTYRWRVGVQSDCLCFLSGTHITHFIIEPVVAQCKVCDIKSFNFQKQ